ncbi:MAG TPA: transcription elongation factor GreA [Anaerolineaceae bacterium]|jgi:transcription elongation factor GreA|nr:transcription elongation factor GreA [Anaerolineaceae bacterium]HPT23466.1 transcription elongation factor GreA [Anaerolineaceae bacterium]
MNDQIILTTAGKEKILAELAELKGVKRLEIARRLKSAIEMGDLSENADYKAAKEDQGFLEGRILELESTLANAIIVDDAVTDNSVVQIGSTVTILEDGDEEEVYQIVGANEANPREEKISYVSPIGSAVLNHKKGDVVEILLPNKSTRKVRILKIA